jgi:hypothetical protein
MKFAIPRNLFRHCHFISNGMDQVNKLTVFFQTDRHHLVRYLKPVLVFVNQQLFTQCQVSLNYCPCLKILTDEGTN